MVDFPLLCQYMLVYRSVGDGDDDGDHGDDDDDGGGGGDAADR